jgi:hypothetical protein
VPCSMNTSTYNRLSSTVSTTRKSHAMIACAWAARNCRQVGPARRGAGSMPAVCRISHTVEAAIAYPSRASSPWILRCPHVGFPFLGPGPVPRWSGPQVVIEPFGFGDAERVCLSSRRGLIDREREVLISMAQGRSNTGPNRSRVTVRHLKPG